MTLLLLVFVSGFAMGSGLTLVAAVWYVFRHKMKTYALW